MNRRQRMGIVAMERKRPQQLKKIRLWQQNLKEKKEIIIREISKIKRLK